ncbi:MAG: energy transducer TonB, partial [Acidobacteriota bacterium]
MFETSLMDLSAGKIPVLRRLHWVVALVVGAVLFTTAWFILPIVSFGIERAVLQVQSTFFGVFGACTALIIGYVWTDTRREGFNKAWLIVSIVPVLNFPVYLVYLFYSAKKIGDWRRASMPLAYILQALLVSGMILYPLIKMEALPRGQLMTFLVAPPPPPPPPPPPAKVVQVKRIQRKVTAEDLMRVPTKIPEKITKIVEDLTPAPTAGVVGGVPGGMPGGTAGGVIGGIISAMAAPPPPPKPKAPKRIRLGGQVQAAKLISKPDPVYPPLAKMARIQGSVRLEAVISRGGAIKDLKVISG